MLHPLLPLLEHARAPVGRELELLQHHVQGGAALLPPVQTPCGGGQGGAREGVHVGVQGGRMGNTGLEYGV